MLSIFMHLHRGKWDTALRQSSPTHNDSNFSMYTGANLPNPNTPPEWIVKALLV